MSSELSEIKTRVASIESAISRQSTELVALRERLSRLATEPELPAKVGQLVRMTWKGRDVRTTWEGIVTEINSHEITIGNSTVEYDVIYGNDVIEVLDWKADIR